MAYPTGVAFKHTGTVMGAQPIHETSSTQLHALGTIVRATDGTYGVGEFIYLTGIASTAQGDLVCYNSKTGGTIRAVAGGTGSQGPVAVAMSDCTAATLYGWYQISGATPVNAATASANTDVYLSATAGQVDDLVNVADKVDGAAFKAATASGYATVQLGRASVAAESVGTGFATAQTDIATLIVDVDAIEALGFYCTLSAAVEAAQAIVVTGQVKNLNGTNVAVAKEVVVRTLAVTDNKGDITVTAGTEKKTVNPATGENVSWITTTAAGAFAVSVANDAVEDTLITAAPVNGLEAKLKLAFT